MAATNLTMKCDLSATELNADGSVRSHVRLADMNTVLPKAVFEYYGAGAGAAGMFVAGQLVYVTVSTTP